MGSRDRPSVFMRDDANVLTININQEAAEGWFLINHEPRKAGSLKMCESGACSLG